MDVIDLLIRLLMAFLYLFLGVRSSTEGPPTSIGQTFRSETAIYDVQVIVQESLPMRVQLQVRGEHADGCELPVIVTQGRAGNTITVEIYREIPADTFCPMILQPYEDTIPIDGTFEPGSYVFIVNGFVVEQTL
jgi:hypothetical protein